MVTGDVAMTTWEYDSKLVPDNEGGIVGKSAALRKGAVLIFLHIASRMHG
jgi:hypothetical protein